MALDIPSVQGALAEDGLDGWLLYDFHGSNPIAARLAGLQDATRMATRRWFYLIPREGAPHGLVHAIERHNLDDLPGEKTAYAGRESLEDGLATLLRGRHRLAMEYSPDCAIPYLSRVDAGTMDLVRRHGVEVVSSGDLVQRFEACWDAAALDSHRRASAALHRIKDRAFADIGRTIEGGGQTTEYAIQQRMVEWFADEGLVSSSAPIVAAQEHAGDPHYLPTGTRTRPIRRDEVVLLDLWGKLAEPGAVYADITWMGFTGPQVPPDVARAFEVVRQARDAAVDLVQEAAAAGRALRGWEVARAARQAIDAAGCTEHVLHRTGHSLGVEVHGNGAHIDDYETHDDRRLLPGSGFTIEPGLYYPTFGVRTEINMYLGADEATVTGPRQPAVTCLVAAGRR